MPGITVSKDGVPQGTRSTINFNDGQGLSLTVADDTAHNRVDITANNLIVPIGANGYVQYYDGGVLNGNTNFVFTLTLPNPTGVPYPGFIIGTEPAGGGAITTDASLTNGVRLVISAGEGNSGDFAGGNLLLFGGGADGGNAGLARMQGGTSVSAKAGDAILAGGDSTGTGDAGWAFVQGGTPGTNGDGGHVKLIATVKSGASVQNGWIYLSTGGADKLVIVDTGAWFIDGANPGAAGDTLVSSGPGASPTWKPTSLGAETTLSPGVGVHNDVVVDAHSRVLLDSSPGAMSITGFAGGADGKLLLITNGGSTNSVTLTKEGSGSGASNRLFGAGDRILAPGASQLLSYSATLSRWIMI